MVRKLFVVALSLAVIKVLFVVAGFGAILTTRFGTIK